MLSPFSLKIPWGVVNCESHILRSEQTDILKCPCFPIIEQQHYEPGSKCLLSGRLLPESPRKVALHLWLGPWSVLQLEVPQTETVVTRVSLITMIPRARDGAG